MIEVHILDEQYTLLHSAENTNIRLLDPTLTEAINQITKFEFGISDQHEASSLIQSRKTRIDIIDTKTNEEILEGRVIHYAGDFDEDGKMYKQWVAEDALGYLHDSKQLKLEFTGKPSELFKKLIERHNKVLEPYKRFDIGDCEVDLIRTYTESGSATNVTLGKDDTATISPTATTIYNGNGQALTMASYVKGVKHKVGAIPTGSGPNGNRYLLNNFTHGYTEGYVNPADILETRVVKSESTTQSNRVTGVLENGTKVSIKPEAKYYYHSNGSTKEVPNFVRTSENIIGAYNEKLDRYLIMHNGVGRGWVNASDLVEGAKTPTAITVNKPNYIEQERTITAEISREDSTWDAIMKHLVEPFGAEIERVKHEAVNTIHIRNRIGEASDMTIEAGMNLLNLSEDFDGEIITRLVAIGNRKEVVEDG